MSRSSSEEMIPLDQAIEEIKAAQEALIAQSAEQDERVSALEQQESVILEETKVLERREAALRAAEEKVKGMSERLLQTVYSSKEIFSLQEMRLQRRQDEMQLREEALCEREKHCAGYEEQLKLREEAQNKRDDEYNAQIAELNTAILLFNQRVTELYAREEELASFLPVAPVPVSDSPRESSVVFTEREFEIHVPWFQRHELIVEDWRPSTYIYDEILKKEVPTGESKIAYLNRVVDEMPDGTVDDERTKMFQKILENTQSKLDPLLCLKMKIALAIGRYVLEGDELNDAFASSSFFSRFMSAPKVVSKAEETARIREFERIVLKSKDSEDGETNSIDLINIAFRVAKTIESGAVNFSSAYQQFIEECQQWIAEYESIPTHTATSSFSQLLIPR